jgi:CRISPR system Cascade subunit CasC
MNKNLYIDLNVLQTVPSSNINRDDTGAPKTALYGGVTRARVSSQSWKSAIRKTFKKENIGTGFRTKEAVRLLAEKLMSISPSLNEESAFKKSAEVFKAVGIKVNKDGETGALLLVSPGQLEKLSQYVVNHTSDKFDKNETKEIKKVLKSDNSLDLAIFGRMVADNPELNVDAAVQVAHAISTHEIVPEFDYYTALDDLQSKDSSGAAMLGTIEFNSATLYRYANVNVNELVRNLGEVDTIQGISAFIKAFLLSMPTGKQNTFANKTLPNYVMITIRTDTPVNLVSAFEDPIKSNHGYVEKSVQGLEDEYQAAQKSGLVAEPILNTVLSNKKYKSQLDGQVANLTELLEKVTETLTEAVQDENTND